MWAVEFKVTRLHKEILKDMQIVNPIGILQFDDGNMDFEVLTKRFNDIMYRIKDSDTSTSRDLTTLANIESMLYLNKDLMPRQIHRIRKLKW